jgi:hypothetical protein
LGNVKFLDEVATFEEFCDDRLDFVLNYFGFVFDTDFDVGTANLGAFPIAAGT